MAPGLALYAVLSTCYNGEGARCSRSPMPKPWPVCGEPRHNLLPASCVARGTDAIVAASVAATQVTCARRSAGKDDGS